MIKPDFLDHKGVKQSYCRVACWLKKVEIFQFYLTFRLKVHAEVGQFINIDNQLIKFLFPFWGYNTGYKNKTNIMLYA